MGEERTYIKGTGFSSMGIGSHVAAVDVEDGKIVRIRPFPYNWKYAPEEFRPWKIEARGQTYHVPLKTTINPFGLGFKKSIYRNCGPLEVFPDKAAFGRRRACCF